ncbi:MAG: hypothetical protein OEN48_10475 [Betaproteobacteria bacterium]|nr:hypothetical protein [Gammaproteobacteria bacterium]MDH3437398.1 hypothetical protein [Betaproteobacteria bacterium]
MNQRAGLGYRTRRALWVAALIGGALAAPVGALAQAAGDQWRFTLTPYLWLPNINGTFNYNGPRGAGGNPQVEVGPNDWLEALDMALLLSGEARKGKWAVFTDVIYLDFSSEQSTVKGINFNPGLPPNPISTTLNAGTSNSLKGTLWTLAGSYTAVEKPEATLDVFGGFRYFDLKVSTSWLLRADVVGPPGTGVFTRVGAISQSKDLWDGIVGVRGRVKLGDKWSLPYYVDVGTGSSTVTWQGLIAASYGFRWGDVSLGYRYLYYDQSGDKLLQDVEFGGPILGVTFRF